MIIISSSTFGKTINLTTLNWEPHYGENLKNQGHFTELTRKAFKASGHDLKVQFTNWTRALNLAKRGESDGLLGAYYNVERSKFCIFSQPITDNKLSFATLKGKIITYKKLEDLKPYKIGVGKDYIHTKEFDNAKFLQKVEGKTTKENLEKLFKGWIDIIIDSEKVIKFLLNKDFNEKSAEVVFIGPPLRINKLYICISNKIKGHKKIIDDFNKGLKIIKENGTYDKVLESHGLK